MTAGGVGNHFRGASCEIADPRVKPEDDDGGGVSGGDGAAGGGPHNDDGVKPSPTTIAVPDVIRDPAALPMPWCRWEGTWAPAGVYPGESRDRGSEGGACSAALPPSPASSSGLTRGSAASGQPVKGLGTDDASRITTSAALADALQIPGSSPRMTMGVGEGLVMEPPGAGPRMTRGGVGGGDGAARLAQHPSLSRT